MTTAVTKHAPVAVAPVMEMTKDQIDLVKRTIMPPDSSDDELQLALYVQNQTGLNMLTRQLYPIKVGDGDKAKLTFQTSIDGFRLIANRTEAYRGRLGPFFTDGKTCPACKGTRVIEGQVCPSCLGDGLDWTPTWISADNPVAAKCGGLREGWNEPLWATAQWDAYAQYQQGIPCPECGVTSAIIKGKEEYGGGWLCFAKKGGCGAKFSTKPAAGDEKVYTGWWAKAGGAHMLGKCAEALMIRSLFPQELSGLYTTDEMDQAATPIPVKSEAPSAKSDTSPVSPDEVTSPNGKTATPPEDPALTDYQKLVLKAKDLNIKTGGKSAAKLEAEITLKKQNAPAETAQSKQETTAPAGPLVSLQVQEDSPPLTDEEIKNMGTAFGQYGITLADIAWVLGLPVQQWKQNHKKPLLVVWNGIKNGHLKAGDYKEPM